MIKESAKIISQKDNESGGVDYILENGTKLGEIMDFLPNGIINKGVTGIGATTLEIESPRNSIIVQPLKATVEQKSQGNNKLFAYNKRNLTKLNEELWAYLSDATNPFKKIILVIDRLSELIFALGQNSTNFFFLFDEIDYMQGSSTYRKNMSIGLDLGVALDNFALVSATHIGFTDPILLAQKEYNFKYEQQEFKPVQLYYLSSEKLNQSVKLIKTLNQLYSCICHLLSSTDAKIMVAINNVKIISEIAEALVKSSKIEKDNISLLISDNSFRNDLLIKRYSGKKLQNSTLPTRLNFLTSAYFNGYDLHEDDLCLIIFSSPSFQSNLISSNEMKQIYGRNRLVNGITKFFIFSHDIRRNELKDAELLDYSLEDWLKLGEGSVEMQNCMDKHLKKYLPSHLESSYFARRFKDQVLSLDMNLSRQKILFSKDNFIEEFFNEQKQQAFNEISYLQIDHLRHYYGYLNSTYVIHQGSIEDIGGIKPGVIDYVSTVERMFEQSLYMSGFEVLSEKMIWPIEVLKKESKSQKEIINESLEDVLLALKNTADIKLKFDGLHKKLFEIITMAKGRFSNKSVRETISECKSRVEIDVLWGYLSYKNFKKSKEYLFIKGNLSTKQLYTLDELHNIASIAINKTYKKGVSINAKTKRETLILVKLVFGLELVHKPGSKAGEKVYKLHKQSAFSNLKPCKKQKIRTINL